MVSHWDLLFVWRNLFDTINIENHFMEGICIELPIHCITSIRVLKTCSQINNVNAQ